MSAGHARTVILMAPDEEGGGGGEGAEAEAAEAEEGGSAHVLSAEAQQVRRSEITGSGRIPCVAWETLCHARCGRQ